MTLDEFFQGLQESLALFDALCEMLESIGLAQMRISKSQVAFWRGKVVTRVWIPVCYLRGDTTPLVLTLGFDRRDGSSRWKEIVEAAPGRFTHHLELRSEDDLNEEVRNWLRDAWTVAA